MEMSQQQQEIENEFGEWMKEEKQIDDILIISGKGKRAIEDHFDRNFELEAELQEKEEPQRQLSKEFVRQWLIANGFQGLEGQSVPFMSDEYIETVN